MRDYPRNLPASEKRQGSKSETVMRGVWSSRYGDLTVAVMVGAVHINYFGPLAN
ncbi:MAG: hypothetical protein VCE75_25545 [Alphaproteobacteria bacterium]